MSSRSATKRARRVRLDDLLVARGDAPDLRTARALILAGRVRGADRTYQQAGQRLPSDTDLHVQPAREFVSRGGEKLRAALDAWPLDVNHRICLDVGASTGGFTDLLLRQGARHVFAVDVGYGQLADALRSASRVTSMERTHICRLPTLPQTPSLATVDVSFIGLRQVLPCVAEALASQSDVVALIKPQFESLPTEVDERGVVRDRLAQHRAVNGVLSWAFRNEWRVGGVLRSPLSGPAGNREWFVWLRTP